MDRTGLKGKRGDVALRKFPGRNDPYFRRDLAVFQKNQVGSLIVLSAHTWKAIFLNPCRQSGTKDPQDYSQDGILL